MSVGIYETKHAHTCGPLQTHLLGLGNVCGNRLKYFKTLLLRKLYEIYLFDGFIITVLKTPIDTVTILALKPKQIISLNTLCE